MTPYVGEAVIKASSVLGELGATVEEVSLPLTIHGGVISAVLINVEAAMTYRDWIRDDIHGFNRAGYGPNLVH